MGKDAPPRPSAATTRPADPAGADGGDAAGRAVDPELARTLAQLSPDQAAQVLGVLEKALKRRKIQLYGYLVAAVVLVIGVVGSLYWYGLQPEGTFVGWVFFVPMGLVGLVLFSFGKWSERYRTAVEDRFEAEQRRKKP